ncbi:unnamed protein product [Effrenium voratum]|uniref:Uncharacterized protein n=1 Tax=Effrenium voratum TaxID=2562239 RepID=A0AA36HW27_9DINO|nr:unnamed protein product [Effrenium voratum]
MAVSMAVGGEEMMSAEQFAAWLEGPSELRTSGSSFVDQLRRKVAEQRGLSNFRQLSIVSRNGALTPDCSWDTVGPFSVVVRPYTDVAGRELEICKAAADGDLAKVLLYLEEPVDPNIEDADQRTPLHWAASENLHRQNEGVLRCLLEVGGDWNKEDSDGKTPSFLAALASC